MLNAGQHIDLMKHGLGKTPDARHDLWATFNRAGRYLVTAHDWYWRTKGPVDLPAVASQSFLYLPDDFGGEVESYVPNNGSFTYIQKVTLRELAVLRTENVTSVRTGVFYIYYPMWEDQDSREDEPRPRAEIYPTPTTNAEPTVQLIYNKRWAEIDANDTAAIPNIPREFEHALVLAARAYAWALENQTDPHEDAQLARELARLVEEDGRRQRTWGKMTGGVDLRLRSSRFPSRFPRAADLS